MARHNGRNEEKFKTKIKIQSNIITHYRPYR